MVLQNQAKLEHFSIETYGFGPILRNLWFWGPHFEASAWQMALHLLETMFHQSPRPSLISCSSALKSLGSTATAATGLWHLSLAWLQRLRCHNFHSNVLDSTCMGALGWAEALALWKSGRQGLRLDAVSFISLRLAMGRRWDVSLQLADMRRAVDIPETSADCVLPEATWEIALQLSSRDLLEFSVFFVSCEEGQNGNQFVQFENSQL